MHIFVVEDAPEIRKRLIAMLNRVPGAIVTGEADAVRTAIDGVLATGADTVLLDLQLKDGSGLEVLAQLKAQRPAVRVIVLTNFATRQHQQACHAAGADVFLDKSKEFGLIPKILGEWIASDHSSHPGLANASQDLATRSEP